jgi:CubicO group peptidase (beta-lactamase class C family)
MNKQKLSILFSILVLFSINGQVNPQIDSLIKSHVKKGFNGNIVYSKGDSILFTGNYGIANVETKQALTDSSLFELGSVSKQFTAIAIITLVEKNKLNYDTKVKDIIADFPYDDMTIEHLLQHRTGLPEIFAFSVRHKIWKKNGIATNEDVLSALIKHKPKLSCQPGTKHEYSNFGYMLLGSIIEKVSGLTYAEYLKTNLFQPAGMATSDVILRAYNPREIANNTEGYCNIKKGKKATEKRRLYFSFKAKSFLYSRIYRYFNGFYGDGGISSSILEMELWKQAFRYNKIISAESKKRMTDILLESGKLGYGFWVLKSDEGIYYYHPGQWTGYTAESLYFPDGNTYVIILSNNNYQKTGEIAGELNDILQKMK